jgi:hypothetical protein
MFGTAPGGKRRGRFGGNAPEEGYLAGSGAEETAGLSDAMESRRIRDHDEASIWQ